MPRTRDLKHATFKNEELNSLPPLTRWLFTGLWTVADREGRLLDRPARIKAELLPYDDANADELLQQLHNAGFITRYESEGCRCIQVVTFSKHQNIHPKEQASELPAINHVTAKPKQAGKRRGKTRQGSAEPEQASEEQPARNSFPSLPSIPSSPSLPSSENTPAAPVGVHKAFIDLFCELWKEHHGCDYPFKGSQDASNVKYFREQLGGDLEAWRSVLGRYFANTETFFEGHDIGHLRHSWAKFKAAPTKTAGDPFAWASGFMAEEVQQ